ncbi:serine/threonine-protein kinase [Archangium sp.]|uniref:serine/threonine protein kinase n=1 Tax=Archangium sp. TaxID=1872627 RepID=UPI002D6C7CA1|nr:serine/threonine-protein kinase [Archangium sp.]HYO55044.1 serine/threonine-protein kinase [Archangium sp.]
MHQATADSEQQHQFLARWRRRQLLRQLAREGAQEGFLPKVGESVGGFTLEARLGAGSYGTVFRARRGEHLYALKLLYLPHAGAWAWRELEVLLRLHRARLVVVDSHGHYCHHPEVGPLFLYIVTNYVPGLPMGEYVERHNPTALWAARAVLSLAAQLGVAHAVSVFHRDIKDDNVVVREDGHAVLVDFGVGTFPGALKVSRGRLPNTSLFRAPEAWRFRRERQLGEDYEASARDDLWALGVLLYWLLTGTWPFHGETQEEVEEAVLHTVPVPPHVRNPRVPMALSGVCLRMLEKAPEARYPDTKAVCQALKAVLAGADAGWQVPLCEAWAPDNATPRQELGLDERERLRHGKPVPMEEAAPHAQAPRARAWVWGWRGRTLALGAGVLLAVAHLNTAPALSPVAVPVLSATPVSWVAWALSGQEVAPPWCPLEGGEGVAPPWAATPAPVAFAMHTQDNTRVKTPRKDSSTQQKKQWKRGTVRNAVANALCTAAVGATAAGCPGAQVLATPKPEACPAGSLEAMKQLGIRTGDRAGAKFPGAKPGFITVREGPGARLVLGLPLGQLEAGTVLTGRLLFGKERVYGRFTEARGPSGDTYRVCLEFVEWSNEKREHLRGVEREPNGGPDTAKVYAGPDVQAVERFE